MQEKPKRGGELCGEIVDSIDIALAENQMVLRGLGIVVKELPRNMQPTEHDPFIDDLQTDPNQGELFQ